ncbi:hypothetical protein LUZ61_013877 [Rhynchospora tenuis]|uniref:Uncharacterized protein n=1 Tax=Rhynchospora tenuis TaxID=198213 RepID=A0AAD5Z165_9POAL|nr:hypothetical protein LUZ61_013877 [Rhynchospora tenuis]
MSYQPTFMIVNHVDVKFCIVISGGKAVLGATNPADPNQRWMKLDDASKDAEGQPTFRLVNFGTNEVLRGGHFRQASGSEVNSVLWSFSKESNQDFRTLRMASNVTRRKLHPSSFRMVAGNWVDLWDGPNDHTSTQWKFQQDSMITISSGRKEGYNLTVRDEAVVLAPADPKNEYQIWIKDTFYAKQVKDQDGKQAFALVNKATGKAMKHGFGLGYLVQLAEIDQNYLDSSLLWTESDKGSSFREIRMQSNTSAVFHAFYVDEEDLNKALLTLESRNGSTDQSWKFQEITA